jgi:hypothetical protein
MSIAITGRVIRLKVDLLSYDNLKDVATGLAPRLPCGNAVTFQLGFFFGDVPASLETLDSLTAEIRSNGTRTGNAWATVTLAQGEFANEITLEDWNAGNAANAEISFSGDDTELTATNEGTAYWFVLSGLTTDVPALPVTVGWSLLTIWQDGAGSGTPPISTPPAPVYLTEAQSDARYSRAQPAGANFRDAADGKTRQLFCPGTGKWHSEYLQVLGDGTVVSVWGPGED